MAIYHCSIKKGKRSDGRSAVACSAYRAGARYTDQETGTVFDYTAKKAVVHHEIFLPESAPAAYQDAEILWNAVQDIENKNNAVLFREFEVALPIELPLPERISCAREFCSLLQDEGMCVQLDIHNLEHNPHAHIMCSTRKIKKDGKWDVKEKKGYVYVRDEDGRPILGEDGNPMREPLIDPDTGKQKLRIRKGKGAEKLWRTEKIEANEWNKRYKVEEWRSEWSETCNRHIDAENERRKENNQETEEIKRVDHRSYERQDLDQIPTRHEGYAARAMEKRGGTSELMDENRDIRQANQIIEESKMDLLDALSGFINGIREKINDIRGKVQELVDRSKKFRKPGRAAITGTAENDRGTGEGSGGSAGAGKGFNGEQGLLGEESDTIGSRSRETAGVLTEIERRKQGTDRSEEEEIRTGENAAGEGWADKNPEGTSQQFGGEQGLLAGEQRELEEESGRIGSRGRETAGVLAEIEQRKQGTDRSEQEEIRTGGNAAGEGWTDKNPEGTSQQFGGEQGLLAGEQRELEEESERIGAWSRETAGMLAEVEQRERDAEERERKSDNLNDSVERQIQQLERRIDEIRELKSRTPATEKETTAVQMPNQDSHHEERSLVPKILLDQIKDIRTRYLQERKKVSEKAEEIKALEMDIENFKKEGWKTLNDFKSSLDHAKGMKKFYEEDLDRTSKWQFMKRSGLNDSIQEEEDKIERLNKWIKEEKENLAPKYAELNDMEQRKDSLRREKKDAENNSSVYSSQFHELCSGLNDYQKNEIYLHLYESDAETRGGKVMSESIHGKLAKNRDILELDKPLYAAHRRLEKMKEPAMGNKKHKFSL